MGDIPPELISLTCSVCLNEMDQTTQTKTSCGHLFCYNCLVDWINRGNNTCPMCRTQIRTFTRENTMIRLIDHENLTSEYIINLNIPNGYVLIKKKLYILTFVSLTFSIAASLMTSFLAIPCYRM